MSTKDTARITISMPTVTKIAIESLADKMGVSQSLAAQHLIRLGLTAEAIAFRGGRIVAETENGEVRVLADSDGNFFHRIPLFGG